MVKGTRHKFDSGGLHPGGPWGSGGAGQRRSSFLAPEGRAAESFLHPTDGAGSARGRERNPAAAQTPEQALPSSCRLVSRRCCSGTPHILRKTSRRRIIPEHCHAPGTEPGGDNPVCPHNKESGDGGHGGRGMGVPATPPGGGGEQDWGRTLSITAAPLGHVTAWADAALDGGPRVQGCVSTGPRSCPCAPNLSSHMQTPPPAPSCAHGDVGGPLLGAKVRCWGTNGEEQLGV